MPEDLALADHFHDIRRDGNDYRAKFDTLWMGDMRDMATFMGESMKAGMQAHIICSVL